MIKIIKEAKNFFSLNFYLEKRFNCKNSPSYLSELTKLIFLYFDSLLDFFFQINYLSP